MFAFHCPRHDARVLVFPRQVEQVRNTGEEIHVDFRCTCGYHGRLVTGASAARIGAEHIEPLPLEASAA